MFMNTIWCFCSCYERSANDWVISSTNVDGLEQLIKDCDLQNVRVVDSDIFIPHIVVSFDQLHKIGDISQQLFLKKFSLLQETAP